MEKRLLPTLQMCGGLLAAILAGGCTIFPPSRDQTRYYVPALPAAEQSEAAARPTPTATAPTVTGLYRPKLASHLAGSRMVVRMGETELRYSDLHRWAGSLEEATARVLADGLQSRHPETIVVIDPARPGDCEAVYFVEILRCEGGHGQTILEARWEKRHPVTRALLDQGVFERRRPGWDGRDYGRLAAELALSMDELAGEMIAPPNAAE